MSVPRRQPVYSADDAAGRDGAGRFPGRPPGPRAGASPPEPRCPRAPPPAGSRRAPGLAVAPARRRAAPRHRGTARTPKNTHPSRRQDGKRGFSLSAGRKGMEGTLPGEPLRASPGSLRQPGSSLPIPAFYHPWTHANGSGRAISRKSDGLNKVHTQMTGKPVGLQVRLLSSQAIAGKRLLGR